MLLSLPCRISIAFITSFTKQHGSPRKALAGNRPVGLTFAHVGPFGTTSAKPMCWNANTSKTLKMQQFARKWESRERKRKKEKGEKGTREKKEGRELRRGTIILN